jgi:formylglycine-generating enzyme required for sulfatase activity
MSLARALAPLLLFTACTPPSAAADVLFEVGGAGEPQVSGFRVRRVELRVLDEEGRAAQVLVRAADETFLVQTPLQVPCVGGTCGAQLQLDPGTWRFELHLFATDRCGTEARVAQKRSSGVDLWPGQKEQIIFGPTDWSFDDDGDGIENALEAVVCGRFDVADARYAPPAACLEPSDPCCAHLEPEEGTQPVSSLIGRMAFFTGSAQHVNAAGTTLPPVAPFWLDATEATLGALERCVAAGRCLVGKTQHPARAALASPSLRRDLPAVGLTALEAQELCEFAGKRLPFDGEWDFAAAFVAPGVRARHPWDSDAPELLATSLAGPFEAPARGNVGCRHDGTGLSANHRAIGRACARQALPVGSFPATFLRRGERAPVADMAGNAWEWTLVEGGAPQGGPHVPAGVSGLRLRGGGWDSPPQLLENDLFLEVSAADVARLAEVAGFRCAAAADAVPLPAVVPVVEPACAPPD